MPVTYGALTTSSANALIAAAATPIAPLAPSLYVDSVHGSDSYAGTSPDAALASIGAAVARAQNGATIGVLGVFTEEVVTPLGVNDVTIVGLATRPRQATTSGAPNGGGATWLSPSGGAGILCTVKGQGWTFRNLFFNNSASQPCVQLLRSGTGDPPAAPDGSHASFYGNVFTGADAGIQASGGIAFVTIVGNTFFNFTGATDCGVEAVTGAGIGTNLGWVITDNVFYNNVDHVVAPLVNATITRNNFIIVGNSVTTTIALSLTGGATNTVYRNTFNRPTNTSPNATLFVGGTNDTWSNNDGTDAQFYGVPDNA
jgi:hypothetical protein